MGNELIKQDVASDLPALKITKDDIRKHFCALATEQEVMMALAIVKSLNLNPFLREVHFVKYDQKSKMSIIVGYEVYLKRAERSGKLNGWSAGINTAENYAWVKIHRKDWTEPFEWQVNLNEFNKKQSTWNQIPSFMGRKVAIAQGFRLAFPDELGGLPYTAEEHETYQINGTPQTMKPEVKMPQAIEAPVLTEKTQETAVSDSTQPTVANNRKENIEALEALAITAFKKDKKAWIDYLGSEYGCTKIEELTIDQFQNCIKKLTEKIKNDKK